jgi:uncharacterized protein (DUF111 family)
MDRVEDLCRIVFEETTTIGLRRHTARRTALEREIVHVATAFGDIPIKVSRLHGRVINFAPEYEDCVKIARERKVALKEVQSLALKEYLERK